ncbi:MAG: hypothetical protein EX270_10200 [Pseudomonadales bacterium]|nr:MAG: hypothetical protein EX270_10200 [Pseudomonadales bacterium]
MVDLRNILDDLDLSAVVLPGDKLKECQYFFNLLEAEKDRDKFRWLLGAFLNACYGHLEYKAAYLHYAFADPETGDPVEDWEALDILRNYVRVFQQKKSGFIKTSWLSELTEKLYKFRNRNTHDGGIEVMQVGDDLPNDFNIGSHTGQGTPALIFCREILEFFSKLEAEIDG